MSSNVSKLPTAAVSYYTVIKRGKVWAVVLVTPIEGMKPLKTALYSSPDHAAATEYGKPITEYYRCSSGASDEAGARDWTSAETDRQRRRHIVGDEAALTFGEAVLMYPVTPRSAKQLIPVTQEIGHLPLTAITGQLLKDLGPTLKPTASTDTWWREVVTPARAVINHAHELKKAQYLRVKPYDKFERIAQDRQRGKTGRIARQPGSKEWIEAFCAHADAHNAALARFMFETAARIDQAVSLEPRDLDLMKRRVLLKAQKGHDAQWVKQLTGGDVMTARFMRQDDFSFKPQLKLVIVGNNKPAYTVAANRLHLAERAVAALDKKEART